MLRLAQERMAYFLLRWAGAGQEESESESCSVMSDFLTPDSSVHWILQAGILEWLPCPPPGDLPCPGIEPASPALKADSLPSDAPGKTLGRRDLHQILEDAMGLSRKRAGGTHGKERECSKFEKSYSSRAC